MEELLQKLDLPDIWQQQGVRALKAGRDLIVNAPTGAGKTRVFELYFKSARLSGQVVYTVPTRALANEKYQEWKQAKWDVGIVTGDLAIDARAPVVVATLETQRERLLRGDGPALLVIDEYQMLGDRQRGLHYELALATAPSSTRLLLLSGSVANPEAVQKWLTHRHGRTVELVETIERPVPLETMPIEGLPHEAPKHIKGFWSRLAVEVLMADLAPLLLFAPQRHAAEKIARQIASSLPDVRGFALDRSQEHICGKELSRLLRKRVAFHHSGLSYAARAGVIEPLAREGQLRVIVATTGLAAGINFSVRSVYITDNSYYQGPYLKRIPADELLQMFGRAGRRGKDDTGYALSSTRSPRFHDARARELRRANEVDWPTLIRVMHLADQQKQPPFEAASRLCQDLFSDQPILLGVEKANQEPTGEPPTEEGQDPREFGLGPMTSQILNFQSEWEPFDKNRQRAAPLQKVKLRDKEHWKSALHHFPFVAALIPFGKVKKLDNEKGGLLGKEIILANRSGEDFRWTRSIHRLDTRLKPVRTIEEAAESITPVLQKQLMGGRILRLAEENKQLKLLVDFSEAVFEAYEDGTGHFLTSPPTRQIRTQPDTHIDPDPSRKAIRPPRESPVFAWRELGLIDSVGQPTRRGIIFSFFPHGEGIPVTAALEDPSYHLEDLVWHLANIRGGYRFRSLTHGESERLALRCREVFGPVNHDGYLRLGLPLQYGESTAEALKLYLEEHQSKRKLRSDELGDGDIERAFNEWVSLLRHIKQAPAHEWDRWTGLQQTADATLNQLARQDCLPEVADLPPLDPKQLAAHRGHWLTYHDLKQQRT